MECVPSARLKSPDNCVAMFVVFAIQSIADTFNEVSTARCFASSAISPVTVYEISTFPFHGYRCCAVTLVIVGVSAQVPLATLTTTSVAILAMFLLMLIGFILSVVVEDYGSSIHVKSNFDMKVSLSLP